MKTHYILDSSAALLGVALIIVTAVHITGQAAKTIADELSFGAAVLFLGSCILSHRAITTSEDRLDDFADKIFGAGLLLLLCAVLTFWF